MSFVLVAAIHFSSPRYRGKHKVCHKIDHNTIISRLRSCLPNAYNKRSRCRLAVGQLYSSANDATSDLPKKVLQVLTVANGILQWTKKSVLKHLDYADDVWPKGSGFRKSGKWSRTDDKHQQNQNE